MNLLLFDICIFGRFLQNLSNKFNIGHIFSTDCPYIDNICVKRHLLNNNQLKQNHPFIIYQYYLNFMFLISTEIDQKYPLKIDTLLNIKPRTFTVIDYISLPYLYLICLLIYFLFSTGRLLTSIARSLYNELIKINLLGIPYLNALKCFPQIIFPSGNSVYDELGIRQIYPPFSIRCSFIQEKNKNLVT